MTAESDKNAPSGDHSSLEDCSLTAAVDVIGGKWTLVVLYILSRAPRRFAELERRAPGVSLKVLTDTLRRLERDRLVDRDARPGPLPHVTYRLSPRGESVRPILDAVEAWGDGLLAERSIR